MPADCKNTDYCKNECQKDMHYKIQTGTSCEKCNSKAFLLGIEPATLDI